MNRKKLTDFITDHGDKFLFGAAAALLLSYVTLSVLFPKTDPNLIEVKKKASELDKVIKDESKSSGGIPPSPVVDRIREEMNTAPPVTSAQWLFEIRPLVTAAAVGAGPKKNGEGIKPPPETIKKAALPAPVLDTVEPTMSGVILRWKAGELSSMKLPQSIELSDIQGFFVERKGPKDKDFVRINKEKAVDVKPADQPQNYDYKDRTTAPLTEYQYRIVAMAKKKETVKEVITVSSDTTAKPGTDYSISAPKKVATANVYDLRVSGWFENEAQVTVRWFVPERSTDGAEVYVYNNFLVKKGDAIGQKEFAYTDEHKKGQLRDPKTKEPIQWDFTTGYTVSKIEKDVKIKGNAEIRRFECDPKYRYDKDKNQNPADPKDCGGPALIQESAEFRKDATLMVDRITCVDTKNKNKPVQFINKWTEGSTIIVPEFKLCPKHGGPKPPPPKKETQQQNPLQQQPPQQQK